MFNEDFISKFKRVTESNSEKEINEDYIEDIFQTIIYIFSDHQYVQNNRFKKLVTDNSKNYTIRKVINNKNEKRKINPIKFYFTILSDIKDSSYPLGEISDVINKIVGKNYTAKISDAINDEMFYDKIKNLEKDLNAITLATIRYLSQSDVGDIDTFDEDTTHYNKELEKIIERISTDKLTHFNNTYEMFYSYIDTTLNALMTINENTSEIKSSLDTIDYDKAKIIVSKLYGVNQLQITDSHIDELLTYITIDNNKFSFLTDSEGLIRQPALDQLDQTEVKQLTVDEQKYKQELTNLVVENNIKMLEIMESIKTIFKNTSEVKINELVKELEKINIVNLVKGDYNSFKDVEEITKDNKKRTDDLIEYLTTIRNGLKKYLTTNILRNDITLQSINEPNELAKFQVIYNNLGSLSKLDEIYSNILNEVGDIFKNVDEINDTMKKALTDKMKVISKYAMNRVAKGFIATASIFRDFLKNDEIFKNFDEIASTVAKDTKKLADDTFDVRITSSTEITENGFYNTKLNLIEKMDMIGEQNISSLKKLSKDENIQNIISKDISMTGSINHNLLNFKGRKTFEISEYEYPIIRSKVTIERFKNQSVLFYINGVENDKHLDEEFLKKDLIEGKTLLVCKLVKVQSINNRLFVLLNYNHKVFRVPINTFRLITPMDIALLPKLLATKSSARMFLEKNIKATSFNYLRKWMKANYDSPIISSVKGLHIYVNQVVAKLNDLNSIEKVDHENNIIYLKSVGKKKKEEKKEEK